MILVYRQCLQRCNQPLSQCTNLQLSPQHSCRDRPSGVTHLIHTCNGSLTGLPSFRMKQASNLKIEMHTNHKPKLVKTNNRYWNKNKTNVSQHIGTEATKPTKSNQPLFQCNQAAFFGNTTGGLLGFTNSAVVSADWATLAEVQRWLGEFLNKTPASWKAILVTLWNLLLEIRWDHETKNILLVETAWNVSCCRSHIMYIKGVWTVASSNPNKKHVQVIWHLSCYVLTWNGMIYVFLKWGFVHHEPSMSEQPQSHWVAWGQLKHVDFWLLTKYQHSSGPQVAKQAYRAWRPKTTKSSKELAPKRFAPCTEAQPAWTTIQAEV